MGHLRQGHDLTIGFSKTEVTCDLDEQFQWSAGQEQIHERLGVEELEV